MPCTPRWRWSPPPSTTVWARWSRTVFLYCDARMGTCCQHLAGVPSFGRGGSHSRFDLLLSFRPIFGGVVRAHCLTIGPDRNTSALVLPQQAKRVSHAAGYNLSFLTTRLSFNFQLGCQSAPGRRGGFNTSMKTPLRVIDARIPMIACIALT